MKWWGLKPFMRYTGESMALHWPGIHDRCLCLGSCTHGGGLDYRLELYSTKLNHKPRWLGASIKPIISCRENWLVKRSVYLASRGAWVWSWKLTLKKQNKTIQYSITENNAKQNKKVRQLYALFVISALGRKRQANRFLRLTGPSLMGKC